MTIDQVGRRTSVQPLLGGRPGDVALFCGSVSVTYGDLSARVDARRAEGKRCQWLAPATPP